MGAILAIDLASKEQVAAVVSLASITSANDVADEMIPFFIRPFIWIQTKFDAFSKIDKVHAPILIIHAKKDNLVPYSMAEKLFDKANEPKYLLPLNGNDHSRIDFSKEDVAKIKEFMKNKKI